MPALASSARSTGSKMRPRMTLSPGMRRVQHRVDGVAQRQRGCPRSKDCSATTEDSGGHCATVAAMTPGGGVRHAAAGAAGRVFYHCGFPEASGQGSCGTKTAAQRPALSAALSVPGSAEALLSY